MGGTISGFVTEPFAPVRSNIYFRFVCLTSLLTHPCLLFFPKIVSSNICPTATTLDSCGTYLGSTLGDPRESWGGVCGYQGAGGDWFKFTAASGGMAHLGVMLDRVALDACEGTTYDSRISVFKGSCNALQCVGWNDDAAEGCPSNDLASIAEFHVEAGETYYVLLHGWSGAEGSYSLMLEGDGPTGTCVG
jgi:hypothetical protein